MKTIRKIFLGISFCIISGYAVSGQALGTDYRLALGLRSGESSGITFKLNTGPSSGLEFIAGIWSNWLNITGLYEIKAPAFSIEGMRWYYGAGGHVAFSTGTYYKEGRYYTRGDEYAMGLDGIVGIEFKIPQIPFAVSFDAKPLVEIYRNGDLYFGIDPGIGVKFTF